MGKLLSNIAKAPELQKRLLFTFTMIAVYRIGVFVPVPGVNRTAMTQVVGDSGGLLGLLNLFTGNALAMMSIFALGIMPYISASIILQLMQIVSPAVERLQKEGESGRKKITQWTRYGTVLLSLVQGFGIATYVETMHASQPNLNLLVDPGWGFRLTTVLTLTTGTIFVMWLGEQITERGVGNGISIVITSSILARLPDHLVQMYQSYTAGTLSTSIVGIIALVTLISVFFIAFMETAYRKIPLQYAKRMVGRRIYGGQTHDLPLKVNMAGVIPPIFASSLLIFPSTIANFVSQDSPITIALHEALLPGDWRYNLLYGILIIFFCYFYTAVQVNPVDMADNLKKSDAFVPGIRPGRETADYIGYVMSRLTGAGSIYISFVCIAPFLLEDSLGVQYVAGGMSLLIAISVAIDTMTQIESHLITRQYDDFSHTTDESGEARRIHGRTESDIFS